MVPLPPAKAVFLLLFLVHLRPSVAQWASPEPWENTTAFALSDQWPITSRINSLLPEYPDLLSASALLIHYLRHVETSVLNTQRLHELSSSPPPDIPAATVCNFQLERWSWILRVRKHFRLRNWTYPNTRCVTQVRAAHRHFRPNLLEQHIADQRFSLSNLYDAILTRNRIFHQLAPQLATTVLSNWSAPSAGGGNFVRTRSQTCTIHTSGGLRLSTDREWSVFTILTNVPSDKWMTKYDRQFLIENTRLTLAGDKFYTGPFNMTLPIRTNTPANLTYMYNATTALVSESGTGLKGIYGYTFHRNNPALQQALDDSNLVLQQAEDAMAASNIAIIMLPLFLNILPISFVSDIRTRKMLIYVISADFLNAAPLCFKGVELIYIGKRRAQSVVTRISSAIGGEVSETAAAEIWAADCTTDNRVHATGVAFVVLAVVVALLGAVGEVVGWIYAYRRGHLLAARANHRSDMLRDKNLFLGIQDRDFSLTDDIGFDTDAKDV